MARIFFSYSHRDEDLRDRLETHLSLLKHQGLIEAWHDRRISVGDDWAGAISGELEQADIILLLVSADFIGSRYCYDVEMKRALERHHAKETLVIPVILRPCDWHEAPFGFIQAAPKDGKPIVSWPDLDDAFVDIVRKLRSVLPRPSAAPSKVQGATAASPVQTGPRSSNLRVKRSFTEADRDRFVEDAFAYMAKFFEGSLAELQARNPDIQTTFRQIDANRFTSVIYRNGTAVSRCKIMLGGMHGAGISFSYNDQPSDNSLNESLNVKADDQGLYLEALGFASMGGHEKKHLTFEGGSEYYWSMFVEPLQK